jgi:hypothetical protein
MMKRNCKITRKIDGLFLLILMKMNWPILFLERQLQTLQNQIVYFQKRKKQLVSNFSSSQKNRQDQNHPKFHNIKRIITTN